jgi:hypothetical protein
MTLAMLTYMEPPAGGPGFEQYVVGLPADDEEVCATDPFEDFDDDDFDDEFDDDFEEEWDDDLPGEDDLPSDEKEVDAPFSDDPDFDEE